MITTTVENRKQEPSGLYDCTRWRYGNLPCVIKCRYITRDLAVSSVRSRQQKHGRPITYRFVNRSIPSTQVQSESGEILLAVIKMCGLGNK
ncbi:hypothetical protein Tco_0713559 [Tanacetum coccineum]